MLPLEGSKKRRFYMVIRAIILFGLSIYLFIQTIQRIQAESLSEYYLLILGALISLMVYQFGEMIGWITDKQDREDKKNNNQDNHELN